MFQPSGISKYRSEKSYSLPEIRKSLRKTLQPSGISNIGSLSDDLMSEAGKQNWIVVSMKND